MTEPGRPRAAPSSSGRADDRRWVVAFLLITTAMGMLDAVSLLHFDTFTGYMTGTVVFIGINLARGAALATAPLVALAALLVGAVAGGRSVRRRQPPPRLVGDLLAIVALLVAFAALIDAIAPGRVPLAIVATLGLAMGLQTSATRHAGVPDMTMPAATMVLHGLAHDSRLAGGKAERAWRRIGVLVGLTAGAAAGAALSGWHVWAGLAATAALILVAAQILRLATPPARAAGPAAA